jgi:hypothetical protein
LIQKYWLLLLVITSLIIFVWGYSFTKTEEFIIASEPEIKTLDSEIDRLSIKYNVSSSTVRAVIKCESSMYGSAINYNRNADGSIWSTDYGWLQVNDYYHGSDMQKLGLEITNEWDSLEYGFMLMQNKGLAPWSASKHCWINKI